MNNDAKSNVNVRQAVPFFMIADMAASLDFYINRLGFELKNKWEPEGRIEWCWLQLDDASLMLQQYKNNPPAERSGVGVSIYFVCTNALKIYEQICSRGFTPTEPFVGNHLWVVQLKDPDGYNILFESPTDIPEETKYADWKKSTKQRRLIFTE